MLHMLDTNIVSHLVRQHPEVVNRYSHITPEKMCISSVTEAELLYGVAKKQNNKLHETIMEFLKTITICDWDSAAAATYGELRAAMEKRESNGRFGSAYCGTCHQPWHNDCYERPRVRDGAKPYRRRLDGSFVSVIARRRYAYRACILPNTLQKHI